MTWKAYSASWWLERIIITLKVNNLIRKKQYATDRQVWKKWWTSPEDSSNVYQI